MLLRPLLTALLPWSKRSLLSNPHTASWLEHQQETRERSLTGVRLLIIFCPSSLITLLLKAPLPYLRLQCHNLYEFEFRVFDCKILILRILFYVRHVFPIFLHVTHQFISMCQFFTPTYGFFIVSGKHMKVKTHVQYMKTFPLINLCY